MGAIFVQISVNYRECNITYNNISLNSLSLNLRIHRKTLESTYREITAKFHKMSLS